MTGTSAKEQRTIYSDGGILVLQTLTMLLGESNTNRAEAPLIGRKQSDLNHKFLPHGIGQTSALHRPRIGTAVIASRSVPGLGRPKVHIRDNT